MAEEVVQNVENNQPSKINPVKEWFRKRIVALKVKPQIIPLCVMVITTVYFMLILFPVSEAVSWNYNDTAATGICVFVTTLVSLLYLVSFLNAFPKRKKPKIFFIVLVFVMIAAQIGCDVGYYVQMSKAIAGAANTTSDAYLTATKAQPLMLGHLILLGISTVVFALLPVYSKLIRKINTAIKIDSATEHMGEKIDIEDDND